MRFFFLLFFIQLSVGQEIPPVVSYEAKDYKADNQNWSITQSNEGWIYVANNKGLLSYDGENWSLYKSPNQSIIRSVHAIDERIYTGCFREFGFWEKNEFGHLTYSSISAQIELNEDEQFWNIIDYKDWIIFQSLNNIYLYNTSSEEIKKIDAQDGITKIFQVQNNIYFSQPDKGIYQIVNAKAELVNNHPIFLKNTIINMYSLDNQLLVQTDKKGIYTLSETPQRYKLFDLPIFNSIDVYNSLQTENGDVILGTISNGVYRISKQGHIDYQINRSNGLANNTVLSLFEDRDHNIWLSLDNGISFINTFSPIKNYTDGTGRLGTVYVSKVFNNQLFLGTNQGLFYKRLNDTNSDFELVEGSTGQVWQLFEYDNELFCGHNNGTFLVQENQFHQISKKLGTWNFKTIPNQPNLLLQGNYQGFSLLEKVNGEWTFKNAIDGFEVSAKSFEFFDSHSVLVDHEYKGVYKIKFDNDFKNVLLSEQDSSVEKGLYSSLIKFQNQILYANSNGIFAYQPTKNKFELHPQIGDLLSEENYTTGKLAPTSEDDFFVFTKKFTYRVSKNNLDNSLLVESFPLTNEMRSSLVGYENVLRLKDKQYLFGNHLGYLTFDFDLYEKFHRTLEMKINSVTSSSVEGNEIPVSFVNSKSKFEAKYNTLEIDYSVPEYSKFLHIEYQYKLKGLFENWSDWSSSSTARFSNLNSGDYTFEVRARMGHDMVSDSVTYHFSVQRPFWQSNLMLVLYFIVFIIIIIITHNAYTLYYKKQKRIIHQQNQRELQLKESENELRLIEVKNQQLEKDIESKNRELAISTMSLIKKNEFLNQLQSEINKYKEEPKKGIVQISKIIKRKLNQNSDWEFFEKAFNNADQDFFKKIKEKHPDLTPNDLKLCAYLRLNLSSKEIAPLFNISPKSVEVKRYRLRKKMNLEREISLTNYILEL